MGSKGGSSGSQQAKPVVGSQAKGVSRKARKAIALGKSKSMSIHLSLNIHARTGDNQGPQPGPGCQHHQHAVHVPGGPPMELCAHLDMYNIEVWLILHEQDMCAVSVKELEEVLAAEESMDNEVEMRKEKECYDAKRVVTSRQEVVEEEDKDGGKGKGESELDEEDDEPIRGPGLLAKAQGKHPAK